LEITDVKIYRAGHPRKKWMFVRVGANEGIRNFKVVKTHPYLTKQEK
jgi:hypothetical protein